MEVPSRTSLAVLSICTDCDGESGANGFRMMWLERSASACGRRRWPSGHRPNWYLNLKSLCCTRLTAFLRANGKRSFAYS